MEIVMTVRKFYSSKDTSFCTDVRRTDFTVNISRGHYFYLYCIEDTDTGDWIWRYRPSYDVRYIYNLPTLPNTAYMSEEEFFQYSLLWEDVWGSDDMRIEVLNAVQEYELQYREQWGLSYSTETLEVQG